MQRAEFMNKMIAAFPGALVEEDNDGQLIIYTGLVTMDDLMICADAHDSGDNPKDEHGQAECDYCGELVNADPDL